MSCEHEKVYAPYVLTSNPPQYPWVCKLCGERGTDYGEYYDGGEYERVIRGFAQTDD